MGAFGSLPVEPTACTCTCGRLHCVTTSSVRGTCDCHGVYRVAPAVYVTSAPVMESTRRLQHIRCTCACRGVHHVSTISVVRRASTGTVHFVPAPASYATYCDCNGWLRFWLYVLPRGPFRAVPPHSGTPFVITMSDGEGTGSVAAAIWSPLAPCGVHQPRWFQLNLPPSALHAWSGVKNSSLSVTSTKLEAIVPAICLCTWSHLIGGSLWPHFIYNDVALACLVSGCSKKQLSLSAVVDYTWAQIPVLGCWPWFERVPSKCNIVDGLSQKTSPLRS